MKQGVGRNAPAMGIALLALFVALGGSVYAAKTKRARIDGRAIRTRSIPSNRLKPHSIGVDRLKPNVLRGIPPATPLTGADINELTLGQVPSAAHAESADTAQSAVDAQTALNAINAVDAQTVNGHSIGCMPETLAFAGACWEDSANDPLDAPTAARKCAAKGGTLPDALELAALGEEEGVILDPRDEWSGDITNVSGLDSYGVVTVSAASKLDYVLSTKLHPYRCVLPLIN